MSICLICTVLFYRKGEIIMRKREEQAEWRKTQILNIALDEFINKGYYGTSTRGISKIAGISSGLMFNYFNSKKTLYETLIEKGLDEMEFDYNENKSPVAFFNEKLNIAIQMIISNPSAAKMFVLMGNAVYNAVHISQKADEMIKQSNVIKKSIPLIKEGQRIGEIRKGDPHALSIAFWCSIQGIAEEIALNPNSPVPETDWIMDIIRNKIAET
jgi:AcrR family transcriptional regulator